VPATAAEQQPPLHGWLLSQAVEHEAPLHADPAGQSPVAPQPHTPALHTAPLAEPTQFRQMPLLPHAADAFPVAHLPALASQQPPLHDWFTVQVVVQWWVPTSQA
jgi:hypothetical protein